MKILIITYRGQQHHATETEEYSSSGRPFIVCNCGATAYGWDSIRHAHNRGDKRYPVDIRHAPEKREGRRKLWDPDWENRQEKREHLSHGLARKDRPLWLVHLVEKGLCVWYGHTPSAAITICVYCQKARKARRFGRDGRWNPYPHTPEPFIPRLPTPRPVKYPPLSTTHGPQPIPPSPYRPAIDPPRKRYRHQEEYHPNTPPEDCPFCMGPPKDWQLRPEPPCQSHHRPNCPICARRAR